LSDEIWHFYAGDPLEVIEIDPTGNLKITDIGNDFSKNQHFQHVVPAGNWFGSRVKAGGEFSLVGCTVAPGFDFADFEMATPENLLSLFPEHRSVIMDLTRSTTPR
jgi:uncharacterized protein